MTPSPRTGATRRTSARPKPAPAAQNIVVTPAQMAELEASQASMLKALDQATAVMAEQNREIKALNDLFMAVKASEFRFACNLLGISPGATQAQIRAAYRLKAKTLHPDAGGNPEAFSLLQKALELLTA